MTESTAPHRCDDGCVCLEHQTPLHYSAAFKTHACTDPTCRHATSIEGDPFKAAKLMDGMKIHDTAPREQLRYTLNRVGPASPDERPGMAAAGRADIVNALRHHFSVTDPERALERAEALAAYYDMWHRKGVLAALADHRGTDEFRATVRDWMCDGGYDDHHRCMDLAQRIRLIAKEQS